MDEEEIKNEIARLQGILESKDDEAQEITKWVHESGKVNITATPLPKVPSQYQFRMADRGMIGNATSMVFELIGGIPRFALWADQNPDAFYPLAVKLEGHKNNQIAAQGGNITVQTMIGPSALDSGYTHQTVITQSPQPLSGEDDDE